MECSTEEHTDDQRKKRRTLGQEASGDAICLVLLHGYPKLIELFVCRWKMQHRYQWIDGSKESVPKIVADCFRWQLIDDMSQCMQPVMAESLLLEEGEDTTCVASVVVHSTASIVETEWIRLGEHVAVQELVKFGTLGQV